MNGHQESKESLQQTVKKTEEERTAPSSGLSGDEIQAVIGRECAGVDENDREGNQKAPERTLTLFAIEEQKRKDPTGQWEMSRRDGRYYCVSAGKMAVVSGSAERLQDTFNRSHFNFRQLKMKRYPTVALLLYSVASVIANEAKKAISTIKNFQTMADSLNKIGKCINFGNCANADTKKKIEIKFGDYFVCPDCGLDLVEVKKPCGICPK
jgi:hypothetical protein